DRTTIASGQLTGFTLIDNEFANINQVEIFVRRNGRIVIKSNTISTISDVFIPSPNHGHRICIVDFIVQLIDIPIDTQQTQVDYSYIRTDTFYFLQIPQRIGIIISESE